MIDLSELRVGDRIKVVDHWPGYCGQNSDGRMDHWLGRVVTVLEINGGTITIEEDAGEAKFRGGHWGWNVSMFDDIVSEDEEMTPCSVATDGDISQLLGL